MTFATGVTLFALLPFLGGSAPQLERQSVILAAGAPAAVPSSAAPAVPQGVTAEMSGALSGLSSAIGGGLFQFPSLALSPALAPSLVAPLPGEQALRFIRPVPGPQSSSFGPRMHPVLGVPMFHTGIDLAAACGTPIRAAASGTVVYAEVSASWGARTIIQHSPTVKTAYGHQSKMLVEQGDVVRQGDIIGLVGTTGWSTGCHLHFDVIVNDRYVDPAPYLGLPSSNAPSIPFQAAPHVVRDDTGRPFHTVEDGDVPIPTDTSSPVPSATPSGTTAPTIPTTAPTTPATDPTTTDPTTTDPTTDPTTTDPTTTDPTTTDPTTTDSTTTDPTTGEPAPTTSEPSPTETTEPTTTTSEPTPTTTTSEPTPTTTSEPATTTTSEPEPTSTSTAGSAESTESAPTVTEPAPTTTSAG
ncbi:M23 family metallopeptidase [Intrasporangium calvum]|uniref:M23 family metallopeptidase n=1 Tax=Intrasporangium calvum TaxID=53358 RepID=A0ABT5GJ29_9MICO|nr:M23 family metallopeptidase [Intrasporangium calvum]